MEIKIVTYRYNIWESILAFFFNINEKKYLNIENILNILSTFLKQGSGMLFFSFFFFPALRFLNAVVAQGMKLVMSLCGYTEEDTRT